MLMHAADVEGKSFAAIDLGSNSFHMIVARVVAGDLQVIDRLRDPVRMGAGLTADGGLLPEVRDRALNCLAQFGERLRGVPRSQVRAVATNTVRQLAAPRSFLLTAETALSVPIEVVSGREEARLIYLGVSRSLPASRAQRLVIDIGGGSTECIIGSGPEALETESVQMGCVASTRKFFADGQLNRQRWRETQESLALELAPFRETYRARGWHAVYGSSGTLKAAAKILSTLGHTANEISREGVHKLVELALTCKRIEDLRLPGLSEDRRAVFAGGLAVIDTVFNAFEIDTMRISESAMREGVLHDLIGRLTHEDARLASVDALARRANADLVQAGRVRHTALALFDQVAVSAGLQEEDRETLGFAAHVHEIGLAISHSQHHQHGAYIIENSDLPGFSRQEQQVLAVLVRSHRRSLDKTGLAQLSPRLAGSVRWLLSLLRLAVTLHRTRTAETLPELQMQVDGNELRLRFPSGWLAAHPLTRADLKEERERLAGLGVRLKLIKKAA
jgi:exopolyphosphatase/guanosine-5'-triphosphate,3'-diphosphate pyrophosphatase